MSRVSNSTPIGALHSDHNGDSVEKDSASPEKKLKLNDHKDSGDNTHHDHKVAKNDLGDNSLKPNQELFSVEEARQHFQSWCKECNVEYVDEEDERYRFSIFKESLEWITHQQNNGNPVAINQWADQTLDEIESVLFCNKCDSESDTEQDHTQEPHTDKEKGYLSQDDYSDDDFFG